MSTPRPSATVAAVAAAALAAAATLTAGCGARDKHTTDFVADGTYGVGNHVYTFVDSSRSTPANGDAPALATRTLPVEVWYPTAMPTDGAQLDAPRAHGKFPLILHSHGFMDSKEGESYITEHLASHGYIVAAPDYPLSHGGAPGGPTIADTANQPLDARFVIDQVLALSADGSSLLAGAVDEQRIAASGLSLGGLTTLLLAFHPTSRDPRLRAALTMAAPSCMLTSSFFPHAQLPLLMVHGDSDLIVPIAENALRTFPELRPPGELAVLKNGSHTAFATLASYLDQKTHVDLFGCSALGKIDVTSFSSLGSEADGIAQDSSVCPLPCQVTPSAPAMSVDR